MSIQILNLKLDGKFEITPQGFLKVPVLATKVGVFKYFKNGKIVRELRPPEEVFDAESLESLMNAPVTNEHPAGGFVTPLNSKQLMVGFLAGEVEKVDGKYAGSNAIVTDAAMITDVQNGKRDVSCGYTCYYDRTPGVWQGQPYDLIQRGIRYNHVAITLKGRQGTDVGLKLDSDLTDEEADKLQKEEKSTMKVMILGKEYEVADDVGAAINQMISASSKDAEAVKVEMDAFGKKVEDVTKEKEQAVAKADSLQVELEKVKLEKKADSAVVPDVKALVKARRALEVVADSVGVKEFEAMEDQELKIAVIKADSSDFDATGKSETYIQARFDLIAEKNVKADSKAKELGDALNKKTETKADSNDARVASMERAKKMSSQPLSATKQ